MTTPAQADPSTQISRREAIRRVSALLGGIALVGESRLLAAIQSAEPAAAPIGQFSAADIAFLDEIAETILPETKTPGAKAAKTGAFMALMVTDCYWPGEQAVFRDGMRRIDTAMKKAHNVAFTQATPAQRTALLTLLDREQKHVMDARDAAERAGQGLAPKPTDATTTSDVDTPVLTGSVTAPGESPNVAAHYFRMMKELALLGYFTSEIGYTVAMRYVETPGRFDPCLPYTPGEVAWAAHA